MSPAAEKAMPPRFRTYAGWCLEPPGPSWIRRPGDLAGSAFDLPPAGSGFYWRPLRDDLDRPVSFENDVNLVAVRRRLPPRGQESGTNFGAGSGVPVACRVLGIMIAGSASRAQGSGR